MSASIKVIVTHDGQTEASLEAHAKETQHVSWIHGACPHGKYLIFLHGKDAGLLIEQLRYHIEEYWDDADA